MIANLGIGSRTLTIIQALPPRRIPEAMSAAVSVFDQAIGLFHDHPDWADRIGGYFCLADGETGLPFVVTLIGSVPLDKGKIYADFCQEKAWRRANL